MIKNDTFREDLKTIPINNKNISSPLDSLLEKTNFQT
ncbi:MAG: hypothetical protein ACJA1B_002877 [Polaribacter sp.]|jgi:hypothetical protein